MFSFDFVLLEIVEMKVLVLILFLNEFLMEKIGNFNEVKDMIKLGLDT